MMDWYRFIIGRSQNPDMFAAEVSLSKSFTVFLNASEITARVPTSEVSVAMLLLDTYVRGWDI